MVTGKDYAFFKETVRLLLRRVNSDDSLFRQVTLQPRLLAPEQGNLPLALRRLLYLLFVRYFHV